MFCLRILDHQFCNISSSQTLRCSSDLGPKTNTCKNQKDQTSLLTLPVTQHDIQQQDCPEDHTGGDFTQVLRSTSALSMDYNGFGLRYNHL